MHPEFEKFVSKSKARHPAPRLSWKPGVFAVLLLSSSATGTSAGNLPASSSRQDWTSAINVHPQTQFDDGYPELAITPDGSVWIAWMGIDPVEGDEEAFFSRWDGSEWLPAQAINLPNQTDDRFPRLSCSPEGTLWVVWQGSDPGNPGTYVGLTSRWSAGAWAAPDTVWVGGDRYDSPEMTSVSGTEAWFVRDGVAGTGGTDIFIYHHVGGSKDPAVQLSLPDTYEFLPSVALDEGGAPWVAWHHIPGPPDDPEHSTVQFSRLVQGVWSEPESLPSPQGINRLRIVSDTDGTVWIVCLAKDPDTGPFSSAVWALKYLGSSWSGPERISDPIVASDSTQSQLSLERSCSGHPRAVWLVRDIDNDARKDILTTYFDGGAWSPVQRVGQLADSAFVEWPSIAHGPGRTWAAYMRAVPPTFVKNVFTTYADDQTTAVHSVELSVTDEPEGVRMAWDASGEAMGTLSRVWRASGTASRSRGSSWEGDDLVAESSVEIGSLLDTAVAPGETYTYWVQMASPRLESWGGPETITHRSFSRPSILSIRPNPGSGTFEVRGVMGESRAAGQVEIYDTHGRLVRSLRVPPASAGKEFRLEWDTRDDAGRLVGSGMYLVRLRDTALRLESTRKLVVLR